MRSLAFLTRDTNGVRFTVPSAPEGTEAFAYARALDGCLRLSHASADMGAGANDVTDCVSPMPAHVLGDDWLPSDTTTLRQAPGLVLLATADGRAIAEDVSLCSALAQQRAIVVPTPEARVSLARRLGATPVVCAPYPCTPLTPAQRAAGRMWRSSHGLAGTPIVAVPCIPDSPYEALVIIETIARLRRRTADAWMVVCAGQGAPACAGDLASLARHLIVVGAPSAQDADVVITGADVVLLVVRTPTMRALRAALVAMAAGVPVVVAEGAGAIPPGPVVRVPSGVGSEATGSASALVHLLAHPDVAEQVAGLGRTYVDAHHAPAIATRALERALAMPSDEPPRSEAPLLTDAASGGDPWALRDAARALAELGVDDRDAVLLSSAVRAIGSLGTDRVVRPPVNAGASR